MRERRLAFFSAASYGHPVPVASSRELRPGEELEGYRVESVAGRGGMGVVYRALDLRLKRPVALKLLTPKLAADPRFRDRFLRESELAASLDHSNVVPVYSAGEADGRLYIAMRFVEGTDLGALLEREAPLDAPRAVRLVAQIAAALDAGHVRGLVHRDVKPGNILIAREGDSEHCYLSDFGLSRGSDEDGRDHGSHLSGTVAYTAPEQVTGEPVDGRADLYSLGCVLHECLTGHPPFQRTRRTAVLFAHAHEDAPALVGLPGLDPVVRRALAKRPDDRFPTCRAFVDAARAALVEEAAERTAVSRSELRAAEAELAENVAGLQPIDGEREAPAEADRGVCPFKGLAAFDTGDARFFFGRERVIAELVARLAGASALGILGASGSGKSSLLRAGLLPALTAGALPDSETWAQTVIRPRERPLEELHRALSTRVPDRRLMLAVDQLEEVFTHCRDESQRRAFLDRLAAEARGDTVVVLAIRADFYGRLADYPGLATLLAENQVLVGAMEPGELRRAIELPAQRAGLLVEPALTHTLVADVLEEPGALPLLSTTLLELWEMRDGSTLTATSYGQSGGVRGSVARLAEGAFESLDPGGQATARSIFLRLAGGDGDLLVRRQAALDELDLEADEGARRVLDALTSRRLVTVSEGTAEVAHEALLREWPRLRGWLEEDAEGRRLHQHLIRASKDWDDRGRDGGDLYRGVRLASVLDWSAGHASELNELERTFTEASRSAAEAETGHVRRTNRRLRVLLTGTVVLFTLAALAGTLAFFSRSDAKHAATAAVAQRLGAQALLVKDLDLSLLLARQAVALDESPVTGGNLQAALARSPAALRISRPLPGRLLGVGTSPDGRWIVYANNAGKLALAHERDGRVVRTIDSEGWSFDGSDSLVAGRFGGEGIRLARVNLGTGAETPLALLRKSPDDFFSITEDARTWARLANGTVEIRDVATGRLLHRLRPAPGARPFSDVNFRAPGRYLIVTSLISRSFVPDAPARFAIWSVRPWRLVAELDDQRGNFPFTVDAAGKRFATGHRDGSITIFDLASGKTRDLHGRHTAAVQQLEFNSDGTTLASSGDDAQVIVWDVVSGEPLQTLRGHAGRALGIAFAADGSRLHTVGLDGAAITWDLRGTQRFGRPFGAGSGNEPETPEQAPARFALSPDARVVATPQLDGRTAIVDVSSGRREALTDRSRGGRVAGVAWRPDGKLFVTTAAHGHVEAWRPDGSHLRSYRGQPAFVDPPVAPRPHTVSEAVAVAFSPDGKLLAASSSDGRVYVWDAASGALVTRDLIAKSPAFALAFSPDGKVLAAAAQREGPSGGVARVWRLGDRKLLYTANIDDGYGFGDAVAFTPDGKLLATGGGTGYVKFWNARTGEPAGRPVLAVAGWVQSIDFDPTGRLMLTAGTDGTTRLFDVAARAPRYR